MVRLILMSVCVAAAFAATEIDVDTSTTCGTTTSLQVDDEVRLFYKGDVPGSACTFKYTAEQDLGSNCVGLCYMFGQYSFIKDSKVSMTIIIGTEAMTYGNGSSFSSSPVCSDNGKMEISLTEDAGYQYNPKKGDDFYRSRLTIFHKCSAKGRVQNKKFHEVVEHAKGYHPTEERESREKTQFITGILLGFGLACIFLVVLLIAYCYTRNSPNRGPNRSVGMPKVGGFKKKMKPNVSSASKDVEMGVKYQQQDPDKKPEVQPMLTSGAEDPEKPPIDTVDEMPEKTKEAKMEIEPTKEIESTPKEESKTDNNLADNNTVVSTTNNSTSESTTADIGGGGYSSGSGDTGGGGGSGGDSGTAGGDYD